MATYNGNLKHLNPLALNKDQKNIFLKKEVIFFKRWTKI